MMFMNEYDLEWARQQFSRETTPNRWALVRVVDNLREWTDEHSDGWAYWPLPVKAAAKAIGHVESRTTAENDRRQSEDITQAELALALRPIKSFLTRQKVSDAAREKILRAVKTAAG